MLEHIKNAQWIWCNNNPKQDEYGEFADNFSYESGKVILQISSDSNYAAYINGKLAAWGQYADFPCFSPFFPYVLSLLDSILKSCRALQMAILCLLQIIFIIKL